MAKRVDESITMSLSGDLDGLTVREVIAMFEEYAEEFGDEAYIDVREEYIYSMVGEGASGYECFVIKRKT